MLNYASFYLKKLKTMKRNLEKSLEAWLLKPRRKPLIIRGARQVGKSTLVKNFAQAQGRDLVEVNLERHPSLEKIFKTMEPQRILMEVEALTAKKVHAQKSILFLDEIQATPHALAALRYFYEERPELPILAAGSLLELVLSKPSFSMPVGRVEYLHLGPMTFQEFLRARGEEDLIAQLKNFHWSQYFPQSAHQRLLERQREFLFVGGMPESVLAYVSTQHLAEARAVHRSILQTYQDDFYKYAKLAEIELLQELFVRLTQNIGRKVKYSHLIREERAAKLRGLIDLLLKARLFHAAYASDCSGIPLKAGQDRKNYKLYFLDIGLLNYSNELQWTDISKLEQRTLVNGGILAEQFIAQHLAYYHQGLEAPELHYWLREGKSANAEVDFILALGQELIPIEVKAGKSGSLKSLQQFTLNKGQKRAVRFDLNPFSRQLLSYQARQKDQSLKLKMELFSLPLYAVEELPRLIKLNFN